MMVGPMGAHPSSLHGLLQCLPLFLEDLMQRGPGQVAGDVAASVSPQQFMFTGVVHIIHRFCPAEEAAKGALQRCTPPV